MVEVKVIIKNCGDIFAIDLADALNNGYTLQSCTSGYCELGTDMQEPTSYFHAILTKGTPVFPDENEGG